MRGIEHGLPVVAAALLLLGLPGTCLAGTESESRDAGEVIRLLPPLGDEVSGKTLVEALAIEPRIRTVVFSIDGVVAARVKGAPWRAKLELAAPPREQSIEIRALDASGAILGRDEITVNRKLRRLKVRILELSRTSGPEREAEAGAQAGAQVRAVLRVRALISTPPDAVLSQVDVYVNDERLAALSPSVLAEGELDQSFVYPELDAGDFVRVAAQLADGRQAEDAQLASHGGFREELDVQLVQLQLMVTNKRGYPIRGLRRRHFQIREAGARLRDVADLFVADEVPLLLGLSIDTSGSMRPIWLETQEAASLFLETTLTESDQGFLVAFDTQVRLVEPRTPDIGQLRRGFEKLTPDGGTALYDSIVFSLLQFDRLQGRRGLVVLTDGVDAASTVDRKQTIELGRRLGVPIYILALENDRNFGGSRQSLGGAAASLDPDVAALRLLTDGTGGRLYRVRTMEHVKRAFAQINLDLRNQYVLTYYTDALPEPGEPPEVLVSVPEMKGLKAKAVFGADRLD